MSGSVSGQGRDRRFIDPGSRVRFLTGGGSTCDGVGPVIHMAMQESPPVQGTNIPDKIEPV